ncbi:MAG: Transglycosylase-like domain [Actinomycetota bacterium]|nr:Transglycosylase-like domain [Actinomycetota bacterium]
MKKKLSFSVRARRAEGRRRQIRRVVIGFWITCVLGAAAGIPFARGPITMGGRLMAGFQPAQGGIETTESAVGMMRFRSASFRTRPAPTPSPTEEPEPYVPPAGSLAEVIYDAASEFGIDGGYLYSVATCESALNVQAYNGAGYYGLFQFDQPTWSAYGYGSIYDPTAQARTAARLLAAGQTSRWPNCA